MNIKELMDWRHDCFFCHEELTIFPEVSGVEAQFSIINNYFEIKSRFVNLSIHIETGKIVELEQDKIMVDEFLQRAFLGITCKCLSCTGRDHLYKYSGALSFISDKSASIYYFQESVYINDYVFEQHKLNNQQCGYVRVIKKQYIDKSSVNTEIRTPFLDLKKLTPEKLEHKLKTYIIFS